MEEIGTLLDESVNLVVGTSLRLAQIIPPCMPQFMEEYGHRAGGRRSDERKSQGVIASGINRDMARFGHGSRFIGVCIRHFDLDSTADDQIMHRVYEDRVARALARICNAVICAVMADTREEAEDGIRMISLALQHLGVVGNVDQGIADLTDVNAFLSASRQEGGQISLLTGAGGLI